MPQAYENLNAEHLKPAQCVKDWTRFFARRDLRPTLGCFSENGHGHLPITRLLESIEEVDHVGSLQLVVGGLQKGEQVSVGADALIAGGTHKIETRVASGD